MHLISISFSTSYIYYTRRGKIVCLFIVSPSCTGFKQVEGKYYG